MSRHGHIDTEASPVAYRRDRLASAALIVAVVLGVLLLVHLVVLDVLAIYVYVQVQSGLTVPPLPY